MEDEQLSENNSALTDPTPEPAVEITGNVQDAESRLAQAVKSFQRENLDSETVEQAPQESQEEKTEGQPKTEERREEADPKLIKSAKHLEEATSKAQESLEKYKELQRKFTKVTQEKSSTKKELKDMANEAIEEEPLSLNDRAALRQNLEKDFEGTLERIIEAKARAIVNQERQIDLARQRESEQLAWLDERIKAGESWLMEDKWIKRIEGVIDERPYLRSSPNPYADAIRFLDDAPRGKATSKAQGPLTPILGANGAEPPPASRKVSSPTEKLEKLGSRLLEVQDRAEQAKIRSEMDDIMRGIAKSYK